MVSAWAAAASVTDPELPDLTIEDLGILREVREDAGVVSVAVTPTYAGCPALRTIQEDVREALRRAGFPDARVRTVLEPAWTTDMISDAGRAKLRAAGIAPPVRSGPVPVAIGRPAACPRCGSRDTEELSRFGSTACKALRRCRACREPFDEIKTLA